MREELLEYYERELAYVRQLGAEFAQEISARSQQAAAGAGPLRRSSRRAPDGSLRLHGGARSPAHRRRFSGNHIGSARHRLAALPAARFRRCRSSNASWTRSRESRRPALRVPAGTQLATKRTFDGIALPLSHGSYPVQLWPFSVGECEWRHPERLAQPVRVHGAAGVIRMRLDCARDVFFDKLQIDKLGVSPDRRNERRPYTLRAAVQRTAWPSSYAIRSSAAARWSLSQPPSCSP